MSVVVSVMPNRTGVENRDLLASCDRLRREKKALRPAEGAVPEKKESVGPRHKDLATLSREQEKKTANDFKDLEEKREKKEFRKQMLMVGAGTAVSVVVTVIIMGLINKISAAKSAGQPAPG